MPAPTNRCRVTRPCVAPNCQCNSENHCTVAPHDGIRCVREMDPVLSVQPVRNDLAGALEPPFQDDHPPVWVLDYQRQRRGEVLWLLTGLIIATAFVSSGWFVIRWLAS